MAARQALGWEPERTFVFVVGVLEWQHDDIFDAFPTANRRDAELVACFRAAGVPKDQIVYLQDRQATTKGIKQAFKQLLANTGPDDLLVVYYCGHGWKDDEGYGYFASYDDDCDENCGWSMDKLPEQIEQHFGGGRALLLADCCYSGYLAEAVAEQAKQVSYACLTSSQASELSTGNWTFTEAVIAALRGQAYANSNDDYHITLEELAQQIEEELAFAEEQLSTFVVHGSFNRKMVLATARDRPHPQVGRLVEAYDGDGWYPAQIIDAKESQFKVHYFGYEVSDQQWVTNERIRELQRPTFSVGSAVEVQWKKKWYAATVLDVRHSIHHIKYDDFDATWNEWVARNRIRARPHP